MNPEFKTVDWIRSANIYEINVRQYTNEGTFDAFGKHLPRLKDMGIKILWFMPIHPIGQKNRLGSLGSYYSIRDYKAINPEFGNLNDFKRLVNDAHQMGFKVIIDWVANHTAWDHVWTYTNKEYYQLDANGNFCSPYDWSDVIQIDHQSVGQQDAMIDAMRFWINECAIDGFRCDMAHLIPLSFWHRARKELDAIKPLFWLAETEDAAYHDVFDATYTWEFLHKMEQYWRGQTNIAGLDEVLYKYNDIFPKDALRAYFTSNHDENSHSGSEYERLGDSVKAFAVLCAMWNGLPLIYSGQELPNKKRLKFFDKDEIEWTIPCELQNFYKTLLELRSENPALLAGDDAVITYRLQTTDSRVFSFLRKNGDREVLVILNLTPGWVSFSINDNAVSGAYRDVFSGAEMEINKNYLFHFSAWDYKVLEK
ncbi:MAG: alpha amylase C-terminal domain-containing protein [Bacteroidetes bacterium]|nr:alpha amylase C-terminal domain-containing protein [Bacteroidota bacterium]